MDNGIDAIIGRNIRLLRTTRGMTQAALGAACHDHLSSQQVSKYELGENQLGCTRLVEFGRILDFPIINFFEGVPKHG